MENQNKQPANQALSVSCKSCQRMTVIEGEFICFREGKTIGLTSSVSPSSAISIICDGWQIGKISY